MTKQAFLHELEQQLELPSGSLREEDKLSDLESWDSMAAVLFIALADEKAGVTLSGSQIAGSKTVGDLLSLLSGRLTP